MTFYLFQYSRILQRVSHVTIHVSSIFILEEHENMLSIVSKKIVNGNAMEKSVAF